MKDDAVEGAKDAKKYVEKKGEEVAEKAVELKDEAAQKAENIT